MIGPDWRAPDRDWWVPHVMTAVFGVLVAAILGAVPGWSAPLHVWMTIAALVLATLAAHATWRACASTWRRRWRGALLAALLAAALAVAATAMLGLVLPLGDGGCDDAVDDSPVPGLTMTGTSAPASGAGDGS